MPRCLQDSLSNDHRLMILSISLCRNPILTRIPDHCRRTQTPSRLPSRRCLRRILSRTPDSPADSTVVEPHTSDPSRAAYT